MVKGMKKGKGRAIKKHFNVHVLIFDFKAEGGVWGERKKNYLKQNRNGKILFLCQD